MTREEFEEIVGMSVDEAGMKFALALADAAQDGISIGQNIVVSDFAQEKWEVCRLSSKNTDQALMRMGIAFCYMGIQCFASSKLPDPLVFSKQDREDGMIENILKLMFFQSRKG